MRYDLLVGVGDSEVVSRPGGGMNDSEVRSQIQSSGMGEVVEIDCALQGSKIRVITIKSKTTTRINASRIINPFPIRNIAPPTVIAVMKYFNIMSSLL
jgi:hypothetical protein